MHFPSQICASLLSPSSFSQCWPKHKQMDFFLCVFYAVGSIWTIKYGTDESNDRTVNAGSGERLFATARLLLVLRCLTLSRRVRTEMSTTWRIRFSIINFVFISIMVIFMYACVGISLMHGHLPARYTYDADPGENYLDDASVSYSLS